MGGGGEGIFTGLGGGDGLGGRGLMVGFGKIAQLDLLSVYASRDILKTVLFRMKICNVLSYDVCFMPCWDQFPQLLAPSPLLSPPPSLEAAQSSPSQSPSQSA